MSVAQEHARLRPVSFRSVRITDEFWAPRIRTARERTLPHCLRQCEQTGRLNNFDKAAGKLPGRFEGYFFNDSDVYKVIEGAAYVLWHGPDPQLEARLDELITRVAAAQQPNGYLNTYFTLTPSEQPWTNTRVRHELYCAGHLLEAGIAYYEVTGKRALLDVALRFVDHIAEVFGPGRSPHVPGHQEIELALVRLYRLTGEERYLRLAEFFVEQRGRAEGRDLYGEYCQDHLPVREQTRMVGHAVRAMYYYSAVTDLAGYNNDPGYLAALERLWHDTVDRKMYITGGIGSTRSNEGFTQPYDLPNEAAYCETCAAVGLCFWSHRLNLLHGQARYADVLERALYNGMLAGVALDGEKFFYVNPLASRGDHHRQPWYRCACCPSNVIRFIPAVGNYIYAQTDTAVYVNLYVGSTVELNLAGRKVALTQETRYPWDGNVRITLNPPESLELDLCLRIPGWCPGARVKVDGESITPLPVADGYVRLARTWRPGAVIELELPMPIRRMQADPRVEADRGRVALQRGPLVYCLEAVDNGGTVFNLALPREAELTAEFRSDLLGGVMTIRGRALAAVAPPNVGWERALYQPAADFRPVEFVAIPYYAWDNRAPGEMVVWLPESLTLVPLPPVSWVRPSASHCGEHDTLTALHDRSEPRSSGDQRIPRFTWWPRRGTREWVQYDFDRPRTVAGVAVYWFDDSQQRGLCRAPAAWKLLYRTADGWLPVADPSGFGAELDAYNRVSFAPVLTDGLRIEVELQDRFSAGILEWQVELAD